MAIPAHWDQQLQVNKFPHLFVLVTLYEFAPYRHGPKHSESAMQINICVFPFPAYFSRLFSSIELLHIITIPWSNLFHSSYLLWNPEQNSVKGNFLLYWVCGHLVMFTSRASQKWRSCQQSLSMHSRQSSLRLSVLTVCVLQSTAVPVPPGYTVSSSNFVTCTGPKYSYYAVVLVLGLQVYSQGRNSRS